MLVVHTGKTIFVKIFLLQSTIQKQQVRLKNSTTASFSDDEVRDEGSACGGFSTMGSK